MYFVYFQLCISKLEGFVLSQLLNESVGYLNTVSLELLYPFTDHEKTCTADKSKKCKDKLRKMFKSCFRQSPLNDLSKRTSDKHACT